MLSNLAPGVRPCDLDPRREVFPRLAPEPPEPASSRFINDKKHRKLMAYMLRAMQSGNMVPALDWFEREYKASRAQCRRERTAWRAR